MLKTETTKKEKRRKDRNSRKGVAEKKRRDLKTFSPVKYENIIQ